MALSLVAVFFTILHLGQAHYYLSCVSGNGGTCTEGANMGGEWSGTNPVAPADSNPLMKCGNRGPPSSGTEALQVQVGATLTAQFLHDRAYATAWSTRDNSNHHGYAMAYLAPLSSGGEGKVMTKIFEDGLQAGVTAEESDWSNNQKTDACDDGSSREGCTIGPFVGWWATDKMRLNGGKVPFPLSANTPPGKYILRVELLTTFLPGTVATAQSYTGCIALQVGSGSDQSATLPQIAAENTIEIPGGYADPTGEGWIHYDLHAKYANGKPPPPAPGPAVWGGGGGGGGGGVTGNGTVSPQAPGASVRHRRSRRAHRVEFLS